MDQGELFPNEAGVRPAPPLATRMRPKKFDDLVGQRRVVDVLRKLTQSGHLPSIVLWGPPGSGKTTLAGLLTTETKARMVPMSAVFASSNTSNSHPLKERTTMSSSFSNSAFTIWIRLDFPLPRSP